MFPLFSTATLVEIARISCKPPRHLHVHIDFFLPSFWLPRRVFRYFSFRNRTNGGLIFAETEKISNVLLENERFFLIPSNRNLSHLVFLFRYPGSFDRVLTTVRSCKKRWMEYYFDGTAIILRIDKFIKREYICL